MVISLSDVSKRFGEVSAVSDINFQIKKGEIVGFVGANGAGKTTTISAILGFIKPTAGDIHLFGEPVKPATAHATHGRIGHAAGDMVLPGNLTARQYFEFVMNRYNGEAASRRLEFLSTLFKPDLDKKIRHLSRGNKQKIALVSAFLPEPELIILDEPTSGLDPVMQEAFLDLVKEEQKRGTTIFMSSHYLTEVADVCSRVILMRKGRIFEDIATKELLERSGKTVRIVTGYKATRPPKNAGNLKKSSEGDTHNLSFVFKGSSGELQTWVAGIKQLKDIEITEYGLEGAFGALYRDDEKREDRL